MIETLVRFNNWANRHLLEVAAQVGETALREPSPFFDHGSAWQTFLHILDAEWSWLKGARGQDMRDYLWDVEPLPDLDAVRAFALRFAGELEQYVAGLSDAALAEMVDIGAAAGKPTEWVRREDILIHICNHGTQHRSEVGHFLTAQGHSPGEVDYLDFVVGKLG